MSWVSLVHTRFQSAVRGSLYKILSHVNIAVKRNPYLQLYSGYLMFNYLGEWNKIRKSLCDLKGMSIERDGEILPSRIFVLLCRRKCGVLLNSTPLSLRPTHLQMHGPMRPHGPERSNLQVEDYAILNRLL